MPYVLVETSDAIGNKELLAAPESWIQRHDDGTVYLCWPNVRNINMLNALLADDQSTPLAAWETHECVIKCANIQSLSVAGKMIKTLQNHWKTVCTSRKRTHEANDDVTTGPAACKKSPSNTSSKRQLTQSVTGTVDTEELEPDESQIIGLFDELRSFIENRHNEARKKLHDGFNRIEKCLHSIGSDSLSIEQEAVPENAPECSQSANAVEFYVNPITCVDEMSDFEERLNDEEYKKQVQHWIDCAIGYEKYPENRMRAILDSLFAKRFLSNFSWTGSGTGKLAFMAYGNIVSLFVYAGTTAANIASTRYVGQFFVKIFQPTTTRPSPKYLTPNLTASTNGENNSMLHTVETLCDTTLTDGDDSQNSYDHNNTEISVNPLTCIEELDEFEAKLDDVEYRALMYKWIIEHVGYIMNPESRMIQILYLLFDRDFLAYFTWIGAKKGSYGMKAYKNVVLLFQYAGTTAAHRADYIFVENFFNKKLRFGGR